MRSSHPIRRDRRDHRYLAVFVVLGAAVLAGCSDGPATADGDEPSAVTASSTPAPSDDVTRCSSFDSDCVEVLPPDTVELRGVLYRPTQLEVLVGTTVTFSNMDPIDHTVTAGSKDDVRDDLFDLVVEEVGDTATFTFEEPGEYPYFCRIHPSTMNGTIVVAS